MNADNSSHLLKWSMAAALITIVLKFIAWALTGSVGLLSDALESFVNLATASFALWIVGIARAPADAEHPFGHGKAEYFSSGLEGAFILAAAIAIALTAGERLLHPQPVLETGIGLAVSAVSAVINFVMARQLQHHGQRLNSLALVGEAKHLMTDVRTTVAVIAGVAIVALTEIWWLDPVIALLVVVHILRDGYLLLRGAAHGLMDEALPAADVQCLQDGFASGGENELRVLSLRTRRAGREGFAEVVIRVPPQWTVKQAHDQVEWIEAQLAKRLPHVHVLTHIEPDGDESYRSH